MTYQTILFDLDGTLLDTLDDLTDAVNRTLQKYGLPRRSRAEVRSYLGNGARRLIELSAPEAKGALLEAILTDYKKDYDANCRVKTAPYPGIPELLQTLKKRGCRLAIVSNKPDTAVKELHAAFFTETVETAVGEKPGIRRKPAPDTVLAAMQALNAEPDSTVYIGDSEVDLETARAAGVPCISVAWGFRDRAQLEAHDSEQIVDSAAELLTLLG